MGGIKEAGTRYVLILAGDHLYRMDYRKFVQRHIDSEADVHVAVQPVSRDTVSGLGILKMGSDSRRGRLHEKPKDPEVLKRFESSTNPDKPFLASMGIYVFNTDVLQEVLRGRYLRLGRDILPQSIERRRVCGYTFETVFWEDIRNEVRFFEVNLHMAKANAPFDFYDAHAPHLHPRPLPAPAAIQNSRLDEVLLAHGCRIYESTVRESVVGLRSIILDEANIQSSILMGANFYETERQKPENRRLNRPNMGAAARTP